MDMPDKGHYDDAILIRVYDEIIRLAQNEALVKKVSRLTGYVQVFYLMAGSTDSTNQGRQ